MNGQSLPDLSLGFSTAQLNSSEAGRRTHTEKTARAGGLTAAQGEGCRLPVSDPEFKLC